MVLFYRDGSQSFPAHPAFPLPSLELGTEPCYWFFPIKLLLVPFKPLFSQMWQNSWSQVSQLLAVMGSWAWVELGRVGATPRTEFSCRHPNPGFLISLNTRPFFFGFWSQNSGLQSSFVGSRIKPDSLNAHPLMVNLEKGSSRIEEYLDSGRKSNGRHGN